MKKEHLVYLGVALGAGALAYIIYKNSKKKDTPVNADGSKAVVVKKQGEDPAKVVNHSGDKIYTTDPMALYDAKGVQIGSLNGDVFVDEVGVPIAAPDGSKLTDITNMDDENWDGTTHTYKSPNGKTYTYQL